MGMRITQCLPEVLTMWMTISTFLSKELLCNEERNLLIITCPQSQTSVSPKINYSFVDNFM